MNIQRNNDASEYLRSIRRQDKIWGGLIKFLLFTAVFFAGAIVGSILTASHFAT